MSKVSAISESFFKCSFLDLLDYVQCPVRGYYGSTVLNKFTQEFKSYHSYIISNLVNFYCKKRLNLGKCSLTVLSAYMNTVYYHSRNSLRYRLLPESLLDIHRSMRSLHSILEQYSIGYCNFPAFIDLSDSTRLEFDIDIVVEQNKNIYFIIVEEKWDRHKDLYLHYAPSLYSQFSSKFFSYNNVKILSLNVTDGILTPCKYPYTTLSINNALRCMCGALKDKIYYPLPEVEKCRKCEWKRTCQWKL